ENRIEPVAEMVANRAGHGDATGFGQLLSPGRDIRPISMDVLTLDDDVAQIDADPEYDPRIFRGRDVAFGHPTLHRNRAGNRLDHTCELDQKAVAGRFDDATLVLGDLGIKEFAPMGLEPV